MILCSLVAGRSSCDSACNAEYNAPATANCRQRPHQWRLEEAPMPGLTQTKQLHSTKNGALLVPLHTAHAVVGARDLERASQRRRSGRHLPNRPHWRNRAFLSNLRHTISVRTGVQRSRAGSGVRDARHRCSEMAPRAARLERASVAR